MISKERWQELLSVDTFVTMPASRAEWERLQGFVPRPTAIAVELARAFGRLQRNPARG